MSDRIAVMNNGHYEQLGDPEALYERPQTRFVAGFLGISNLLPATRTGVADGYATVRLADTTEVRIPAPAIDGADQVEIGVRPEKIRIHAPDDTIPAGHNRLAGTVRDASYVGVSTSYVIEGRGGMRLTVYEQNVERASASELWSRGEEVHLSWSPDHTFAVPDSGATADDERN